jgi:rhomboid protease GluP
MNTEAVRIATRSRRQAMDWSLVLASQGLDCAIDHAPEAGWGLLVAPADHAAAVDALRQYQLENRHWPWRRDLFKPGLLFDWASLAWVAILSVFFWLSEEQFDLRAPGMMDNLAVNHHEWWRLFTAVWLHADLSHLVSNATLGILLLGLAMGRYGTGVGILAGYLAGVGGNGVVWLMATKHHQSLGASGMVMGCLGLLAVQSFRLFRPPPQKGAASGDPGPTRWRTTRYFVSGLLGGTLLFVLLGLSPETDVIAHFGGFVCGLILGGLLALGGDKTRNPTTNLAAGLVFVALTLWPWWLALSHH